MRMTKRIVRAMAIKCANKHTGADSARGEHKPPMRRVQCRVQGILWGRMAKPSTPTSTPAGAFGMCRVG